VEGDIIDVVGWIEGSKDYVTGDIPSVEVVRWRLH
jgi:hypothetical protein